MKTIREYLREDTKNVCQIQDKLDEIMDNFDFGRVHKAMEALNWHYRSEEDYAVPNVFTLRKTARSLLKDVIWKAPEGETSWWIESGGFRAECKVWDINEEEQKKPDWKDDVKHQVDLFLSFIVEDCTSSRY